jgi:hypothetical protein
MEPTTRVELVTCRLRNDQRQSGCGANPRKQRIGTWLVGVIRAHLSANCGTKCGTALSRFTSAESGAKLGSSGRGVFARTRMRACVHPPARSASRKGTVFRR